VSSATALIGVAPVVPDALTDTSADLLDMLLQLILCVCQISDLQIKTSNLSNGCLVLSSTHALSRHAHY